MTGLSLAGSGLSITNNTATTATNLAAGSANQIPVQSGPSVTTFITAPTISGTSLQWNGVAFVWAAGEAASSIALGITTVTGGAAANNIIIDASGTLIQESAATLTAAGTLNLPSVQTVSWNADLLLNRAAAANLRLGAAAIDTAPVAQTLSVQNTLAGGTSNVAGANFTIAGSQGKGTGVGGSFIFQVAPAGSTGTAVNALVTALTIDSTKLLTAAGAVSINGAAIGTNALAVTGTVNISSNLTVGTAGGSLLFTNGSRIDDNGGSGLIRLLNNGAAAGIVINVGGNSAAFRTSNNGADAPLTAAAATFSGALTSAAAVADSGYNYQTPSTGFSITMANTNYHLILDPAGTLATGTITMCAAPIDGQIVDIKISQIITALTVAGNSGQSVKGNPTSAAVGSSFTGIYRAANTTWYF